MPNKVEELKKAKDGLDVWPDLVRYAGTGFDTITPDDMARFRWYGIYEQQPRAGHFMMRVKIPGGAIQAGQWRTLGEIARDYGRGIADITTRQNIQFHWLTIETLPKVVELINSVGLSTVGACGDITRNIAGCPVAGLDPDEIFDCRPLVEEISAYFLNNHEFSDLPRKYKITISGCPHRCHQPEINDVGLSAVRRPRAGKMEVGFHLRVGGGLSTQPKLSQALDMFILPHQVPEVCRAITEIFRDHGYRDRRNHARLKFLVADWGAEKFQQELAAKLSFTPERAIQWLDPTGGHDDHLGEHRQRQSGLSWLGATVLSGRLSADAMLAASDIAERFCGGELRTTNQQNLIFPNIATEDMDAAKNAIRGAGYDINASPMRRTAVACTGTEFCNLAITETKLRLREIVDHLESTVALAEPLRINLNGCPNACGQHYIGDIGLQGCLARVDGVQVEAYDVCLGGRLGADARFTRAISRKVPANRVKFALANLLSEFKARRTAAEPFGAFTDRHSDDELGAYLGLELLADDDPSFVPPPARHACASIDS